MSIRDKLLEFFKSDLFQKVLHFFKCLSGLKKAALTLKKNITNFINAMEKMNTLAGFIYVFINAICNWQEFKQAIEYMVSGAKNHGASKANFIGKFIGQIVVAIGDSN